MKKIYIVQTHSSTRVSKIIKVFTKSEFTHVSISLNKKLTKMYSFGRRVVKNPFNSGFVVEKLTGEFYKKYSNTHCRVFEIDITYFQYMSLKNILKKYEKDPMKYGYDIIGLLTRIFRVSVNRKNKYVCSQFIAQLLEDSDIYSFNKNNLKVKPSDFNDLPYKIVYIGKLVDYQFLN